MKQKHNVSYRVKPDFSSVRKYTLEKFSTNPCREQIISGFVEGVNKYKSSIQGEFMVNGNKLIQIGADYINPDQVVRLGYDLTDITPELSSGDIYDVTVTLELSTGAQVVVSTLEELRKVVHLVANDAFEYAGKGGKDLPYYIKKSADYHRTVEENNANRGAVVKDKQFTRCGDRWSRRPSSHGRWINVWKLK